MALHLIDGSSYLFRAFHGSPRLSNTAGEPTGALFGVLHMIRRWIAQHGADQIAFVFDHSSKTFRNELYPLYKANRPPTPDELKQQIAPLLETIEALGLPILRIPGVEADDVIGTLTKQARAAGVDVLISTSDKDLTQLIEPGVRWLNTMSNEELDEAGVKAKFGVRPDQIIDFLALMGDTVDNIPGVAKCGPVTAAKWLLQYGTLDSVIAHASEIGGKIGENLRAALPQLPLSRQLATVKTDCELPVTVDTLRRGEDNTEKLKEIYSRYEFLQWLKELELDETPESTEAADRGVDRGNDAVPLENTAQVSSANTHEVNWIGSPNKFLKSVGPWNFSGVPREIFRVDRRLWLANVLVCGLVFICFAVVMLAAEAAKMVVIHFGLLFVEGTRSEFSGLKPGVLTLTIKAVILAAGSYYLPLRAAKELMEEYNIIFPIAALTLTFVILAINVKTTIWISHGETLLTIVSLAVPATIVIGALIWIASSAVPVIRKS